MYTHLNIILFNISPFIIPPPLLENFSLLKTVLDILFCEVNNDKNHYCFHSFDVLKFNSFQ